MNRFLCTYDQWGERKEVDHKDLLILLVYSLFHITILSNKKSIYYYFWDSYVWEFDQQQRKDPDILR